MSYHQFGHVDPGERLDYAEEPPPEEEYPRRRILPGLLLFVGVLAVFVGGMWFAYRQGQKHAGSAAAVATTTGAPAGAAGGASAASVPLIRADPDPVKVKPEKVGGMNIPDRDDPIYGLRPGGNPAEHILPPPETPAPRPVAPPPPPPVAAAPQAAPGLQPLPAPLPAPPQVAAVPKPAPQAGAKPTEPAAAGPPTKIQLASLRTPDQARDEWTRLKRENADLLGRLSAVAVKADLGERGIWYRVEAGPVDREAATRLCKALRERDLECSLVR